MIRKTRKKNRPQKVVADTKKVLVGSDKVGLMPGFVLKVRHFAKINLYFAQIKLLGSSTVQKKVADDFRKIVDRDLLITGGFSQVSHSAASDNDALIKQKGAEGTARLSLTIKPDMVLASIEHKISLPAKDR